MRFELNIEYCAIYKNLPVLLEQCRPNMYLMPSLGNISTPNV